MLETEGFIYTQGNETNKEHLETIRQLINGKTTKGIQETKSQTWATFT